MARAPITLNAAKNMRVASMAAGLAAAMVGLAYASVPLYQAFCQATGFGGTTQRAEQAPAATADKYITVRFDANTADSLGWKFNPVQATMRVKIGEQYLAHYNATNLRNKEITGTAIFNVTPAEAGAYFNKIQCFCFTAQTLKSGETADLPVDFFVDPAILDDADLKAITEITLSYTFFEADKPKAVSAVEQPAKLTTN